MATNLEFIKSVTLSSATTLDVTDVFSSKYDVYKVALSKAFLDSSGAGGGQRVLEMQLFDSGGTIISASEYDYAVLDMRADQSFVEQKLTGTTRIDNITQINNGEDSGGAVIYFYNPNDSSSYTFVNFQGTGTTGTYGRGYKGIGVHKSAETISGFRIFNTSAVSWNAECSVYGVK